MRLLTLGRSGCPVRPSVSVARRLKSIRSGWTSIEAGPAISAESHQSRVNRADALPGDAGGGAPCSVLLRVSMSQIKQA